MVFWIASVVGLGIAYLFGSTPTGYLAGKLLKGIDIREHGSNSVGATNVLRTLGKWPALVVLLVDVGQVCTVLVKLPLQFINDAGKLAALLDQAGNDVTLDHAAVLCQ